MILKDQNRIRTTYYNEAIRYMENARETLKKAGKQDRFVAEGFILAYSIIERIKPAA